jgi:hypothetical protein
MICDREDTVIIFEARYFGPGIDDEWEYVEVKWVEHIIWTNNLTVKMCYKDGYGTEFRRRFVTPEIASDLEENYIGKRDRGDV